MSTPGWYPDPSGVPQQQRWWDGARWTEQVRPVRSGSGRTVTLICVAVLLVVALGVWGFLRSSPAPVRMPVPSASPTASAWNEESTPDPSGARPAKCDPGPSGGSPSSSDPLTSGRLRMTRPSGWDGPSPELRTPLAQEVWGYTERLPEKLPWISSVLIGLVTDEADADTNAAAAIIQCILTSSFYTSVPVTLEEYRVSDTSVDGVPALQADALISFTHRDLKTKGSRLRLVIVRTEPVRALFLSVVPQENTQHLAAAKRALESLHVVG